MELSTAFFLLIIMNMNHAIFNIDYLAILFFVFGTERFSFGQGATDVSLIKARLNRKIGFCKKSILVLNIWWSCRCA